jgi:hypothetical protein
LEFWREENRTLEKKEWGKYYYSIVKTMEKKSNTWVLSIEFKDNTSIDSMHWASGVRSYSINVFKNELSNTSSNYSNIIYNKSDNFPIYNPDWTKTESDVKNIVLSDLSLTKSWRYQMIISAYDWAWNETKVTFYYIIYPTDEWLFDLSSRKWPNNTPEFYTLNKSLDWWDKYANNSDYYQYTLVLRDKFWNFISNKNITNLTQSCNWLSSCEEITFDMVDREWWNATTLTPNKTTTDVNWEYKFNLKSYTPWTFSEVFQIKLYWWWDDFTEFTNKPITWIVWQPSNSNIFKSPFNLKEIVVLENDWKPIMWKQLMYNVGLEIVSWKIRNTENWILEISRDSVKPISSWHIWNQTSSWFILESSTNFILNNGVLTPSEFKISWIIWIWASSPDQALAQINVSTTNLPISYNLDWKSVRYSLNDVNVVWCEDISTLWVKVVWTVQWSWINQSAWLEENFSDLSKSEARAKIRQNAYTLVRNMINNQVLNWVKYVEWDDIRISWDLGYETLIVKNWNVIITWDLNTSKNKLWIIVLKDGYDVIEDWDYLWNVYVSNTVKEINAIIYADWALRSADENWNSYWDEQLWERLTIEWSLFTRNTIWWIIWWWVSMTLPWWQKTDDYELASVYDLNYIRKTPICSADDYSLLIKYNPSIITNPPKWFTTN